MRLRRQAKFAYVILAVLFAATFAFLGVGSGSSGLDQLFNGLNFFHHGGPSVSKAQQEARKHPNDPKGFRDLATAYEAKGDTADAISALQQYTTLRPKDAKVWNELAGLQLSEASNFVQQYQAASQASSDAAPSKALLPTTGKFASAFATNPFEEAASSQASSNVSDLSQKAQLGFNNALSSYKRVTSLQPRNAAAWFTLAQAAQSTNNASTAVDAYKHYLKLSPDASTAPQIRQLIKQLSPRPAAKAPSKKKK